MFKTLNGAGWWSGNTLELCSVMHRSPVESRPAQLTLTESSHVLRNLFKANRPTETVFRRYDTFFRNPFEFTGYTTIRRYTAWGDEGVIRFLKNKLLPIYCWEPQNVINSDHTFQSFKSENSHKYNAVLQKVQSPTVNTFLYNKCQPLNLVKIITSRQNKMEHTCSVCGENAQRCTLLHKMHSAVRSYTKCTALYALTQNWTQYHNTRNTVCLFVCRLVSAPNRLGRFL
jgi:hypothetical protein